jgi:hypothetical protein
MNFSPRKSRENVSESSTLLNEPSEVLESQSCEHFEAPFPWKKMAALLMVTPLIPLAFELIFPFVSEYNLLLSERISQVI